jgi:polar amino acid transport system substrate-binding protein
MQSKTRFLLWVVAIAAVISTAGCSSSAATVASAPTAKAKITATGALGAIEKAGVIRVGMTVDPPFVLQNPDGSWSSFNPTMVNLLGKYLGVKVDFVPTTGTAMVAGLQAGQYDIIGASISATPAREQAIDFTVPYAYGGNSWLVSTTSKYKKLSDLNNSATTVAYNANTFQATATTTHLPKAQTRALTNVSYADLVSEITSGNSNAISVPSFLATAIANKYKGLKPIPAGNKGIDPTGVAWGVPKNEASLVDKLNAFLNLESKNGTTAKLYAKYITVDNALK